MLIRTRFGKWVVVACMAALGACTSEGDGTVGANELNVIFPSGTTAAFEIGRVTVDVFCTGATNDFFGEDPSEETIFTTDLEFVNTSDTTGQVFHAFMDLLGSCTFSVSAFDKEDELFCTGGPSTITVAAGSTQTINIDLFCDVSQNIPTGMADLVIDNVMIMVGNFCPFVYSLETIPEVIPIVPPPLQIPNPNLPTANSTEFQLCALDAADVDIATQTISSCGTRCDTADGSDPGNLSYQCTATLPDGTPSQGTFVDNANGGLGQDFDSDPTTYNGWCSNAALAGTGLSLPPSVGYFQCSDQEPGVTVTIECCGGDGDVDCDKCKDNVVTCSGANLCVPLPTECNDPDTTDCTVKTACDPAVGGTSCVDTDAPDDQSCDFGGNPGICSAGTCVDAGLCTGVICDTSPTDCVDGGTCDPNTGSCPAPIDLDGVACDTPASGPGICETGTCIGNCTGVICDTDPTDCTDGGSCDPADGSCPTPVNQPQGTTCDVVPGSGASDGQCDNAGVCVAAGPPTYDLTNSIFKPYNSLLPDLTGTGQPDTDCAAPDLSGNPGANLTGITTKCLIILPPDVSGSMTFDETSPGVFDVTGEQTLDFVIDVIIAAFNAQVVVTTNSVTVFTGTGTGSLPGTITLDPLTAPFNINAAATGNVNCLALNLTTGEDVSDAICPLANLPQGGDNPVPLPGDPGQRTFPPLTVTATDFQLAGGPSNANGWYLSNPPALAGNGTQWVALAGVLQ